jgi:acyl phosphate:glycerol-3-phosphate acyltransferase
MIDARLASAAFAAFWIGAFPTAYLWGRFVEKTDIRRHGSGNVGATNALRVFGKKAGAMVFAADFLKGLLPVRLYALWSGDAERADLLLIALAAILGHVFTPFLGFKGGKGVATGGGALLGAIPKLFAVAFPAWLVVFAATRIVSVSSLAAVLALVAAALLFDYPPQAVGLLAAIGVFLVWTHRDNLKRLARGEEKKLGGR